MKKILKTLAIVLIIGSNIVGCTTIPPAENVEWPMPREIRKKQVNSIPVYKGKSFTPTSDGLYLDKESAENLLFNIDELDAYIEKQSELIKQMKDYYNAK